jgi:predicted RNase H-like HicB family nuclease
MKDTNTTFALRCYAKQQRPGEFVAVCVDLNLVAVGQTLHESVRELRGLIQSYLDDAAESGESFEECISRPVPFRFKAEYFVMKVRYWVSRLAHRVAQPVFLPFSEVYTVPRHA